MWQNLIKIISYTFFIIFIIICILWNNTKIDTKCTINKLVNYTAKEKKKKKKNKKKKRKRKKKRKKKRGETNVNIGDTCGLIFMRIRANSFAILY